MEALLPAFITVLLTECDGKVQRNTDALALHFHRVRPILLALIASTLISLVLAGIGGAIVAPLITYQARTLLLGLAFLVAGGSMVLDGKPVTSPNGNRAFPVSLWRYGVAQFGDNSQFIVFAFAARSDQPLLAGGGGLAAILVAAAPALILPGAWRAAMPVTLVRRMAAGILILAGLGTALSALQLI